MGMEAEILQRKRRIQEIREKALKANNHHNSAASGTTPNGDNDLSQEVVKELPQEGEHREKKGKVESLLVDAMLAKPADVIKAELEKVSREEVAIIPKKVNWDLKKQIEGKLEKLRRRTQKAIVEILREKLATEEDN
eukprot:scaffold4203_cov166-Ochromonas_danica.AAC.13